MINYFHLNAFYSTMQHYSHGEGSRGAGDDHLAALLPR